MPDRPIASLAGLVGLDAFRPDGDPAGGLATPGASSRSTAMTAVTPAGRP